MCLVPIEWLGIQDHNRQRLFITSSAQTHFFSKASISHEMTIRIITLRVMTDFLLRTCVIPSNIISWYFKNRTQKRAELPSGEFRYLYTPLFQENREEDTWELPCWSTTRFCYFVILPRQADCKLQFQGQQNLLVPNKKYLAKASQLSFV